MTVAIKKQLDEGLRDALLAFYLDKVLPDDATTKNLNLKTAQDLYEYWLLDVLVSQDVPTTPVACAIASLQQYIHRILLNLEPGYDSASVSTEQLQAWRNELHQYPTWAAHQKLLYFPAMYLDPLLRLNKSENFRQLETDLSQNRIQPDAVQSAVLAYLTRFEEVANLNILSGYIDGRDFANSTYYFIAKSRSENTYFWRSLNMAQRPLDGAPPRPPAIAPKLDQPDPYAWSDWEKADVPIPENAVEHSIRPVWFNNRLFVVWAECIHQDQSAVSGPLSNTQAATAGTSHPLLRLSLCFRKADGSWSAPRVCLQGHCRQEDWRGKDLQSIKPLVCSVAEHHHNGSQDLLFLALGAKSNLKPAASDNCVFLKTTCIDKSLSTLPYLSAVPPKKPEIDINDLSDNLLTRLLDANDQRIQTRKPIDSIKHEKDEIGAFLPPGIFFHTYNYPPNIGSVATRGRGNVQFIDFAKSSIKNSDDRTQPRQPIRLNTVFSAELIRRTENSLDELFDRQTQHLPEPELQGDSDNKMDFHGPYGRYFTELFLYVPWLIAHRLNIEQRYEEAEHWLRHLFDPGRGSTSCWRSESLVDSHMSAYGDQARHDPHQIALSHPVHFRKALYWLYLDILINRGDAAYRELTPDSLSEAKLWYVRVQALLGPRAAVQPLDQWTAIDLETLSDARSDDLRAFEYSLGRSSSKPSLRLRQSPSQPSLPAIDTPHLKVPFNPGLLKRWDIIDSRLNNLRHNLDIAGKPLHLPIFAAAQDPGVLPGTRAWDIASNTTSGLPNLYIPHYRFTVMYSQALGAVESLSQFGATLLSLTERKEQAQLQELQQQQAWDLAKISVDLQRQALNVDRHNRQALLASKAIVEGRARHYRHLLNHDLNEAEALAGRLYLSSASSERNATQYQAAAGSLMLAPNIFGFSMGGSRLEGTLHTAAAIAQGAAVSDRASAAHLDRTAQFHRRRQDWILAYDQAHLELTQIDTQLAHFTEQETATRIQLRLAESSLSQAKAHYDFFNKRFTKAQLYQWLNSQFATLYRQAYDATLALCVATQACWQYELADFDRRFIRPGIWNTTYRGLGVGEQLRLSLLNMQAEYLRGHRRELEIRKTVSLRQLKSKTADSTINQQWAEIHADLMRGKCEFELTHELFEDDYKDQQHYLRRIKTISVSLPALVGPYENIRATLTQTASKVFMSADGQAMESRHASQQIALSTGVDDNGLFTLNFNDDRYLPFEYTGAISTWCLTFPNPEAQRELLESLTDIIVHVSYTARSGVRHG